MSDTTPLHALATEPGTSGGVGTDEPSRAATHGATHGATRIGRFAILERIGAGGMGEVFAAYDEQLDRKVALKIVHPAAEGSPTSQARLLREARALARLSHPNVVTVFDSGVENDEVFVAMEFVRGQTLHEWLGQAPRSCVEILEAFIAAGRGLEAMHELGLVHRDFKPTNVLIDERGRPRLIDFGIVGELEQDDPEAPPPEDDRPAALADRFDRLTRTGAMIGTPRYMSPEQFEGRGVSTPSDQFSFCLCLFEALYRRSAFAGDGLHARIAAVLDGRIELPAGDADVPRELGLVVLRGLQRDPDRRWPGMGELLAALATVLEGYERGLDPSARRNQRRMGITLVVLSLGILACGLSLVSAGSIELSPANALATDVVVLTATGAATLALRSRWQAYVRARRFVGLYMLVLTVYTVQDLVGYLTDRSLYHSVLGNAAFLAVLCLFAASLMGPALLLCGAWAGLCTALIVADPAHHFAYFTAGNVGVALLATLVSLRTRAMSSVWQMASAPGRGHTEP
jgi:serine/threonine-protein kinase